MTFQFTEEHLAIQEAAREFAQKELLNGVIERDEAQHFPKELLKKIAEMGFFGILTPEQYGGSGMDMTSYILVMEELSKIDASASVMVSVNNSLVCQGINQYGTEEQKQKYLPILASGEKIGAFCLSEPEAGSDATNQKTTAIEHDDYYLINGTKNWITNGNTASIYIVIAQTKPELGHKGISAFIVERETPGFIVGKKENKMGIRASDTHTIMFTDMKVAKSQLLGKEGQGFKIAMEIINGGRIGIAAQAVGIAAGALELCLQYVQERKAFGKKLIEHQSIQFKLAEMATKIEAARLLCLKAGKMKDEGLDYSQASAMAKLYAAETAMYVTTEAVQIHGGYGYVKEYHVERLMRDAKITQIYEGTSEIQKIVISRGLMK